jgi:hypothetical protein
MTCGVHAEKAVGKAPLKFVLKKTDVLGGCPKGDVVEVVKG